MHNSYVQKLNEETRIFFDKYEKLLPNTIYYQDWKIVTPKSETIKLIQDLFRNTDKKSLCIAEIGIGMGATSYHIAKFLDNKGSLHLFDFLDTVIPVKQMLNNEGYRNIVAHGSSYKKMDSYNWNLAKLLQETEQPLFDYVFLDGAHSFPVDGLAFFLADMLLKPDGFIDFDDYNWTHAQHIQNSSSKYHTLQDDNDFGSFMKRSLESYTTPQLQMKQVALVVDVIVQKTNRYRTAIPGKLYQKMY